MSTKLSVDLPDHISKSIQERAAQTGSSVERVVVDTLKNAFSPTRRSSTPLTEHERAIHALIAAGLLRPPENSLRRSTRRISAKRRAELAKAFSKGKSLSEIVIEDRGDRV